MLECVPNFSEGRDAAVVRAIVQAIQSEAGVRVLGWESDEDHHRSVITFAGHNDSVIEAAVRGAGKAAELIDLRKHFGVHPRVGAADVIPFIPLAGANMDDAVAAARRAGEEIWSRFGVPVYFYGAAARRPNRQRLELVRRTGFDGAPQDVGDIAEHPTAGAAVVGARGFLIAYNVLLETPDTAIAQAIAKRIRESSGGFKFVKAIGLHLKTHDRAQVSMNLTNFAATPLEEVFHTIEHEALQAGTRVHSCELIGFVPQAAFDAAPAFFRRAENFIPSRIIEAHLLDLK
ncbi:MAG TPA: glutamate formimidoyltransferase [Bryobacteraceae bacterium]|jgi:glutamate formiminotransferase